MTDEQIIEIANRYLEVLDNSGNRDGAGYLSFFGKRNGPNGLLIVEFARALLAASQPKPCLHIRLHNDTCEDCGATFLFI